ncbi:MAG TPA: asparagine synthase (glutamine-hydrolyzing) [Dongiaceae bacterium]|nr:asparagine synthase (glutamine-hydrolyzing) [Dongiaceae bacterium]
MCGLAGEIACTAHGRADTERALPMLQAILHRGPDDVGAWQDPGGGACLLHARLALVDPSGGKQPMATMAEDVVIAFNGEIYGFKRMRRELERSGATFRTRSDTEVLLQLYLHFGPDFVRRLEGEFAFALIDRRNALAMLARDRFGVKPLFTSVRNGLLLFGSEAKAILAHPWSERQLDLAALSRELHGTYLPQDCVFAGVSAVEPGTYLLVSRRGVTTHRYFRLEPEAAGTAQLTFDQATEVLEATLSEAVRERFHGDAPVGLFLSGGVDSSSVAALASETKASQVSAYSIDFVGTGESERSAAELAAKRLGLRAVFLEVAAEDMEQAFETSVWHAEAVVPNPHGTAKMLLARRAKRDVKAVLTGEGSDELHGGYAYFEHAGLLAAAANGAGSAGLSQFLKEYGPRDGVMPSITPKVRAQMAWSDHGGAPYAALRARAAEPGIRFMMTPEFHRHAELSPSQAMMDWLSCTYPDARALDDVTLSRLVSLCTDLPRYNLCFLGDRSEMANGLEARVPFLDTRVADLLWRMPSALHRANGEGKRVLRAILARRLPKTAALPKRNFLTPAAPAGSLLRGPLADRWLSMAAIRRAGIYRPAALAAVRQAARVSRISPSIRFYLGSCLTMALSAHLIGDMFCDRFSETMTRRAAMTLNELRARIHGDRQLPRAAE